MADFENPDQQVAEEVERLGKENASMAFSNYMGKVSVLRADILLKMQAQGLDPEKTPWMYFVLQPSTEGSLLSDPPADMLVMCGVLEEEMDDGKVHQRPRIRIFRSELFQTPLCAEYLTTDVIVDQEADAQYLVDSVRLVPANGLDSIPTDQAEAKSLEAVNGSKAHVPFFAVSSEGKLTIAGEYSGFTVPFEIYADVGYNVQAKTMPFGHYSVLLDAEHAVDVAIGLFGQVKDLDPVNTGELGGRED